MYLEDEMNGVEWVFGGFAVLVESRVRHRYPPLSERGREGERERERGGGGGERGRAREQEGAQVSESAGDAPFAPHQPSERDQIAFFRSLICTGARRNPATCGTNQGG